MVPGRRVGPPLAGGRPSVLNDSASKEMRKRHTTGQPYIGEITQLSRRMSRHRPHCGMMMHDGRCLETIAALEQSPMRQRSPYTSHSLCPAALETVSSMIGALA